MSKVKQALFSIKDTIEGKVLSKYINDLEQEQTKKTQEYQETMRVADKTIKGLKKALDDYEKICVICPKDRMNEILKTKIKELEEKLDMAKSIKRYDVGELLSENIKLRTQLHELPKKICDEIKMQFYYQFEELIPSVMADKIDAIQTKYENN